MSSVLELLIQRQETDGLLDKEMAAKMGISRSLWTFIRNGKRNLTYAHKRKAASVWPDLKKAINKELMV